MDLECTVNYYLTKHLSLLRWENITVLGSVYLIHQENGSYEVDGYISENISVLTLNNLVHWVNQRVCILGFVDINVCVTPIKLLKSLHGDV